MKQLVYFLFLLLCLSCNNTNNPSTNTSPSDIQFDLSGKEFIDSTFHRDYNSYITAFIDGNANKAIKYLHTSIYAHNK